MEDGEVVFQAVGRACVMAQRWKGSCPICGTKRGSVGL